MIQVGWFVVGHGKFGSIHYGQEFEVRQDAESYWKERGYTMVPAYVPEFEYDEAHDRLAVDKQSN